MIKSKRSSFNSPKLKKRRRNVFVFKITAGILLVTGLVYGLHYVSSLPNLLISNIDISGNSAVPSSEIADLISRASGGSYFGLIPKSNFIVFPKEAITDSIKETLLRIQSAEIKLTGLTSAVIMVKEREPYAIWCAGAVVGNGKSDCYFIDSQGLLFGRALNLRGSSLVKYYGFIKADNPVGNYYLAEGLFESISSFIEYLKKYTGKSLTVNRKDDGDIVVEVADGGKFIFNETQDLSKIKANLEAADAESNFVTGEKGLSVYDYIDLRFGNRVFIKKK